MASELDRIMTTLQAYFDGFHDGDVDKLTTVFHPEAHLYTIAGGRFEADPMEDVYARVRGRPAPSAQGQKRQDRILMVDRADETMAFAKVQLAIGPRLFTDYLTLLRMPDGWHIIAKAYTWTTIAAELEPTPA